MYDFENASISARFFDALDYLREHNRISGYTQFCAKYGINRRNMMQQKVNPMRQIFKPCWLTYLVRDYGVSADWLLTGNGEILRVSNEMRAKCVQEIQALLATLC